MKQQVTRVLWTCDYRKCKARTTTDDVLDTPSGWVSMVGALQTPQGGGPASLDLCAKHATALLKSYHVRTDIDEQP